MNNVLYRSPFVSICIPHVIIINIQQDKRISHAANTLQHLIKVGCCNSGSPSVFFAGDFSTSFSSGLDFSGDFGFRTVFFSLNAVLAEEPQQAFPLITGPKLMGPESDSALRVEESSPDTVDHRFFLGWGFGDGSLGAHNLPLVLFLPCFAVFVLVGLGCAIFP